MLIHKKILNCRSSCSGCAVNHFLSPSISATLWQSQNSQHAGPEREVGVRNSSEQTQVENQLQIGINFAFKVCYHNVIFTYF